MKRVKRELTLKLQADKASETYIEVLFLYKLYKDRKYLVYSFSGRVGVSKVNNKKFKAESSKVANINLYKRNRFQ